MRRHQARPSRAGETKKGLAAMMFRRTALLAVPALLTGFAAAAQSSSTPPRRRRQAGRNSEDAATERLNDEALAAARSGQGAPGPGPDTTRNLNSMSDRAAQQGRNQNSAPMPYR
jgi:hypothetical protein